MARLFFALVLLTISCVSVCAQEDADVRQMHTIEGNISSVDWVGSVISVNNIVMSVSPDIQIRKGSDTIGLDDVNMGDPVVVTYYIDSSGANRVVNMSVQYSGDFAV